MVDLIIEDGSGKEDANSYATVAQIINYALARGVTLSDLSPPEDAITIMAIQAMDYLDGLDYLGTKTYPDTQALAWPRKGVCANGDILPSDTVPRRLVSAQCQLCIYIANGIDIMPVANTGEAFIKREKIGPIDTEYSEAVAMELGNAPVLPAVDALLSPLLDNGFDLRTVRV